VPLTDNVAAIVARWSGSRGPDDWIFPTTTGTAMRLGNWKRAIGWSQAKIAIRRPTLRVHDLRHTTASIWLASGADPKVVQQILGHASAAMTMDLYGHLIDEKLWTAAKRVSQTRGHSGGTEPKLIGEHHDL
jgi:integrase